MDLLNINLKSFLPDIIDAYKEIYGPKYYDIIEYKLNNSLLIYYNNYEELRQYIENLKTLKKEELMCKFLDKIGVDIGKFQKKHQLDPLSTEALEIITNMVGNIWQCFENDDTINIRLLNREEDKYSFIKKRKVDFINFLRGSNVATLTMDQFDNYIQTDEYKNLKKQVDYYNKVYDELSIEYKEWYKQYDNCLLYINQESERKDQMMRENGMKVISIMYKFMPPNIQKLLDTKSDDEKWKIFFTSLSSDFSGSGNINYFDQKHMDELTNPNIELIHKWHIIECQVTYFESLGLSLPYELFSSCETEEDVKRYLNFLNREDMKNNIPTNNIIKIFKFLSSDLYNQTLFDYYTNSEYFKKYQSHFANIDDMKFKRQLASLFHDNKVCVFYEPTNINEFTTMLYTICGNGVGYLDMMLVHECGHIIDLNSKFSGFHEITKDKPNPYNSKYIMGERFNETLTDMFALEALEKLKAKGINMLDYKGLVSPMIRDLNTYNIVKQLLNPLVSDFREQVIDAKVNGNPQILINCIGENNYNELIDIVNKVDYLCKQGLIVKLEEKINDEVVKDYYEQVTRTKVVYNNIYEYYNNYLLNEQQSNESINHTM